MTQQTSRVRLAQEFLGHLGRPDTKAALEMLSPSATYDVIGRNEGKNRFSTTEEILEHLRDLGHRTQGTLEATKWDDWLIGDRHIACIAHIQAQSKQQLYVGRELFVFAFDDANLIERVTVVLEDAPAAARFFGP
jgi:hypothetical protein